MGKYFIVDRFCRDDDWGDYFDKTGKVSCSPKVGITGLKFSGEKSDLRRYISTSGPTNEGYRSYSVCGSLSRGVCKKLVSLLKKLNAMWVKEEACETVYGRYTISELPQHFLLSHYFSFTLEDLCCEPIPRRVMYMLDKTNLSVVDVFINFGENDDGVSMMDSGWFTKDLLKKMSKSFLAVFEEIDVLSAQFGIPIDYIEVGRYDIVDEETNVRFFDFDRSFNYPEVFISATTICEETGSWEEGILGSNAIAISV